jgi:hypothetical protein
MTRWWLDVVSAVADVFGLPLVVLLLLLGTTLVAVLLYTWPAWVPRRWPHRPEWTRAAWWARVARWRPRRRGKPTGEPVAPPTGVDLADDSLPDLPAGALASLADLLAADGRYAEAVRERLRSMVRGLVDRQVIDNSPGWTVTELAAAASAARPEVGAPLTAACRTFSDLWYGMSPALREHDERMRAMAAEVTGILDRAGGTIGGRR